MCIRDRAYEVHERPGLLRVPLLEEELLFITASRPGATGLQPAPDGPGTAGPPDMPSRLASIDFEQVLQHELVLPGQRDGVRQQVLSAARRLALEVRVQLDVSSISTIKNIVMQGEAAAVVPYGNVRDDLLRGSLQARRITDPGLRRTLYLVRSRKRAAMRHESALLDLLGRCTQVYCQALGELAHPYGALEQPLSQAMATAMAEETEAGG